jgi:WD40 repeat protein
MHRAAITALEIDDISGTIITSSMDGTVRTWTLDGCILQTFRGGFGFEYRVSSIEYRVSSIEYRVSGVGVGVGHIRKRTYTPVIDSNPNPLTLTR